MIARIVGELGAHLRRLPGTKRVIVAGELMDDAETVLTSGKAMARMSIAVEFHDVHGHKDHEYITVVAFDGRADFCARSCRAGRFVLVEGRRRTHRYVTDAGPRVVTEVVADNVNVWDRRPGDRRAADGQTDVEGRA